LIFRDQPDAGFTIKIWYHGVHPTLTAYSSVISEYIHPQLAKASLVLQALDWINSQTAGSNDFWMQKQNKAEREYEIALNRYKMWKPSRKNKVLVL